MIKIIVYTCLFGGREPFNPKCLGETAAENSRDVTRIIFTDRSGPENYSGSEIYQTLSGLAPSIAARRAKMMPHLYLPPHEWSIYIDNRASLLKNPEVIVDGLNGMDESMFLFRHPVRNCIYDEAIACLRMEKDSAWNILRQISKYSNSGFPRSAGLWAGTLIVRRGNDPGVAFLGEQWFSEISRASARDQISLPYLAQRLGISIGDISGSVNDNDIVQWPLFPRDETQKISSHGPVKWLFIGLARAIRRSAPTKNYC